MIEISPRMAFKSGAIICFVLAILYFWIFIMSLSGGVPGEANNQWMKVSGKGTVDIRHDTENFQDLARAKDATDIDYREEYTWGVGIETTGSSSFMFKVSAPSGDWNTYRFVGEGAGHATRIWAKAITGQFAGEGSVRVWTDDEGTESLETKFNLDSMNGSAKISIRVINGTSGRPLTQEEADLVGQFILEHYLLVSNPADPIYDPLGFCGGLDKDMVLADDVPGALYFLPENTSKYDYALIDGMVVRQLNSSRSLGAV